MVLNNKISILINTCDKYYCALEPFFILWKKYCSELKCKIYLNMEKKVFYDNELNILNVNCDTHIPWSNRLKNVLNLINTDYVISLHEDYFMNNYANIDKLKEYIEYMDDNINIACLSLVHFDNQWDESRCQSVLRDYEERSPFSLYQLQTSGLWRKDLFYNYVRNNETPWQMESYGNMRTWIGHKYQYLVLKKSSIPALSFVWKNYASAIWHGKWFVSLIDDLFKENNIYIDYNILGCVNEHNVIKDDASKRKVTISFILLCWFKRIKMLIGHFDYLFH